MRKALVVLGLALAGCVSPAPVEGPVYEGKPLAHWLREMEDLSQDRREDAAKAVVAFGAVATPSLAAMLRDGRVHVRQIAGHALARMGREAEAAGQALVEAFTDPDERVRRNAMTAVWNLGEYGIPVPGAVEAWERSAENATDPGVRESIRKDLEAYRKLMADQEKRKAHGGW
jgi:hypothetical protein